MKKYNVTVNGEIFTVSVEEIGGAPVTAPPQVTVPAPKPAAPPAPPAAAASTPPPPKPAASAPVPGDGNPLNSPLPGTILRINVSVGQAVKAGEVLLVLEAMKMENDIVAPGDGVVKGIHVTTGATVQSGDLLITI
ncbi:MAG: biotin/lipoyl-binding protein [Clostridiales bacterium]|jgi:biotin carboxyl carrier protein|nr:biotin/lipoyl-binding protein [Clostridiales bacterium]MDR2711567.1 biotin/lipoyl-binding protein [Clostridiales bacterium]